MSNATQKGNRNRLKTKKYFEALGYDVAVAEQAKFCFFGGKLRVFKKDLFGADLIAMDGKEIIFIQCKTTAPRIAECKREFAKWKYPASVVLKQAVVCWKPRARIPIITPIKP